MKTIRNMGGYAVCAAVTLLTACTTNPVDEVQDLKVVSAPVVVAKKEVVLAKAPVVKPKKAALTAQQVKAKKQQIIAMGKAAKIAAAKKAAAVQRAARARVVAKKAVVKRPAVVLAKAPVKRVVKPVKVVAKKVVVKRPVTRKAAVRKPIVKPQLQYAVNKQVKPQYRKAIIKRPVTPKRKVQRIDPDQSFGYALSNAAINRTKHRVRYDGAYIKIGYPGGDVPKAIGVCTDVVIRAYRKLGIDLQKEVHEDISRDFYAYPNLVKWGLTKPDPNIDHRRVYNLQAFFKRHNAELPRSRNPKDYKPGDLVTWMVGPSFPHIGVVVNKPSKADPNRLMISHNIGRGPQIEDILFSFPMTGHYRYTHRHKQVNPALHYAKTPAPASVQRKTAMDYNQLLEASRHLLGNGTPAKPKKNTNVLHVKQSTPARINLAQLDTSALNALLKN